MSALDQTAMTFIDTPYQGGTLDTGAVERLVFRTDVFDCMTLVEMCLAMVYAKKKRKSVAETLEYIRYRGGKKDGFSSRLHYALDWIHDNEQKGILKNITADLKGIETTKEINFMTTHTMLYPRLVGAHIKKMAHTEKILSAHPFFMIPPYRFDRAIKKIKYGDIVFFTTNAIGLDTAHVGIAHKTKAGMTFIHASSLLGKVVMHEGTIADYCQKMKNVSGLIVCRPA